MSYACTRVSPVVDTYTMPSSCAWIGHLAPRHGSGAADGRDLEQPVAQVVPARRGEAVEAAVHQVLGQVDATAVRVDCRGLVLEHAHRRPAERSPLAGRVALPDESAHDLLTRKPCAPRRPAARAIPRGAVEYPV